ncbi:MAG: primosomal protein N' [Nitrospiria bacterium]
MPEVDGRFHYHLPSALQDKNVPPGARLLVPFGKTWKLAFCIRTIKKPDISKTKAIGALLDKNALIRPELLKLLLWISDYYMTPLGGLIKTGLPQGMHMRPIRRFRLTSAGEIHKKRFRASLPIKIIDLLIENKTLTEPELQKHCGRSLGRAVSALKKRNIIQESWEIAAPTVQPKVRRVVALRENAEKTILLFNGLQRRAPKQAAVLKHLLSSGGKAPVDDFPPGPLRAAVGRLLQKGLLRQEAETITRKPRQNVDIREKGKITLNKHQAMAVETIGSQIEKGAFATFLLHGVTGSGKTEVYLRAIEKALNDGRSAILLLPEIGLSTHIAARFHERFGERMALFHSGLSAGERLDEWRRIKDGQVDLVIGARSAVFAPFRSLGAIIVDEEHDPSYRQEEGSRYHARDVAIVRGRDEEAVVILGSATPSFESYYNSQNGKYRYLHLPERIGTRPLPKVHLVDLKKTDEWCRPFFTNRLVTAIKDRLAGKEQVLLFVNRRGFSPFLLCRDCGHSPSCRHCSVSLTYHKGTKCLTCHYCAYRAPAPTACPECHGIGLQTYGIGTEQVETHVRALFPDARVSRLDRDTVQKKGSHGSILGAMNREETDILIGTQMIAKGHDFPKVTLVGVLAGDLSLHLPDFRSSERTFQLLTQVAGRAGRGRRPGEVIIQTFQPDNHAIRAAITQHYTAFFEQEIAARKERNFPPFGRVTLLLLKHRVETTVAREASSLADRIKMRHPGGGIEILGPAPAPLPKIKDAYRYQICIKGKDQRTIGTILKPAMEQWRRSAKKSAAVDIEIDPQQFV